MRLTRRHTCKETIASINGEAFHLDRSLSMGGLRVNRILDKENGSMDIP